ncbi:MAG: type II secretion system F family protein [Rickettsiales bacterium]|jgi:type II secretory pathway component PulF|nr:type II secretion system F family protein [Rickettsiales bacterium]
MNKINLFYAKTNFRFNSTRRFALYRKLSSLLQNNFTLMDALQRIYDIESAGGKKPDEPFAMAVRDWSNGLESGKSFADAVADWVPLNEVLMLTLGDVSKLSVALENLVRVGIGGAKIKSSLLGAAAYPLFLLAMTIGIIIMVGIYLVPPLTEAAGGDIAWRGIAKTLVGVSNFAKDYWPYFTGFILIAIGIIWLSLANWSGRLRARFDNLPPWNVYKISVSAGWLMSLAAIVESGGNLTDAVKLLANHSSPYLRNILFQTYQYLTNGDNLGKSLAKTGANFPNSDIIGDLEIYADMTDFDKNLSGIANTYLDDAVRRMTNISSSMNSIGILLVSVVIGWVVFGTFEMQEQITSALG